MTIYSHSRLSTFEQCPYKFKLKYIDEIIPEIEQSIEAHLGKVVHETLEWLYKQIKLNKIPTIHDTITHYSETWERKYKPTFVIVRKHFTAKDYFNKGVKFLLDYYLKNKPFDENTIEIEKRIIFDLDEFGDYKIQGFIDRLTHNKESNQYAIHDYKTANNLPNKTKIETDRQLPLYAIAIQKDYNTQNIQLIWHYLAFNRKIYSQRTDQQLTQLQQQIINLIKEIESTQHFLPCKSALCNWCEYKTMCPIHRGKTNERQEKL